MLMSIQDACSSERGRFSPAAPRAARRRAPGCAVAVVVLALQWGPVRANQVDVPPPGARGVEAADELQRLQYIGRARPDIAAAGLLRYVDTLRVDDPRRLETLLELGSQYVGQNRGDEVEKVASRIEALSVRVALARTAGILLRAQWLQTHGQVSQAERQIIEASALMPVDPPDYLRLRMLITSAFLKHRGGHYDEAMTRYNDALKLVDRTGPVWRRIDLRVLIFNVLLAAGQTDKAAEVSREHMRLATESADEVGLAAAYSLAARQLGKGKDDGALLADLQASLEHARRAGSKRQILIGMDNIADYRLEHGDFQAAYDLSQTAFPLALEANDLQSQMVATANKGLALIGMKRKDEGMLLVRDAIDIEERSGKVNVIAELTREQGSYLEQAGYAVDALAAYRQYRQMSDELNRKDRQRALIEVQESFANEGRQHELDMLSREAKLKDEEIRHHDLQLKQWAAAGFAGFLLVALVGMLGSRLRLRNRMLKASNDGLRVQAEIDPLTGLSNRHHLQAVVAEQDGSGVDGTLYLLDVDHFKRINDQCGHAGGDAVLVEIARRLRQALRDDDLVVRWGGEEFLVRVGPLPQAEAEALALRLLHALADAPVLHEGRPVQVTASVGFARFPMRTRKPPTQVDLGWERAISLVDAAMYLAKSSGRNAACGIVCVDATSPADVEQAIERLKTSTHDDCVDLHLQRGPEVDAVPAATPRPLGQPLATVQGADAM